MLSWEQKQEAYSMVGYEPTPEQEVVHRCEAKYRIVTGGERAGKSKLTGEDLWPEAIYNDNALYWIIGHEYKDTRVEFTYALQELLKLDAVDKKGFSQPTRGSWTMQTKNGTVIQTLSTSQDARTIASYAPDGIVIGEAGKVDYETFLRCFGRLSEKSGWLLASGTIEKSNRWYVDYWHRGQVPDNEEGLVSFSVPTWTNRVIFPGGRYDPKIVNLEILYRNAPGMFDERVAGIPSKSFKLVFREFDAQVHVNNEWAKFDPKQDVMLWIDPGYVSAYAVEVAQHRDFYTAVVDEIYEKGKTTSEIIQMCQQKPWWDRVTEIAIDIAGQQHQAMESPIDVWKTTRIPIRAKKIRVPDGVMRHRDFLRHWEDNPVEEYLYPDEYREVFEQEEEGKHWCPRMVFNGKCEGAIWEYDNWEKKDPDGRREDYEIFNCDAMKAIGYGLVNTYHYSPIKRQEPTVDMAWNFGITPMQAKPDIRVRIPMMGAS